MNMEIFWKF